MRSEIGFSLFVCFRQLLLLLESVLLCFFSGYTDSRSGVEISDLFICEVGALVAAVDFSEDDGRHRLRRTRKFPA